MQPPGDATERSDFEALRHQSPGAGVKMTDIILSPDANVVMRSVYPLTASLPEKYAQGLTDAVSQNGSVPKVVDSMEVLYSAVKNAVVTGDVLIQCATVAGQLAYCVNYWNWFGKTDRAALILSSMRRAVGVSPAPPGSDPDVEFDAPVILPTVTLGATGATGA